MGNIKIISDSTCDLSPDILEKHNISIVPLYVRFDEDIYKDGLDITTDELYKKVESLNKLPKTSAPSPADFYKVFKSHIEEGKDIIYIGISSKFSSTIQNAKLASQELEHGNIKIIDSLNLSTGIGILTLKAAQLADNGLTIAEISQEIKKIIPKVRTGFIIDTLNYLHKGGRCTALQSFVGNMLKIRPLVKVVGGGMILGQKARGKRLNAINILLKNVLKDKDIIDKDVIMITHSLSDNDSILIKKELENTIGANSIIITNAGCVISSHCGPNTVGVIYITK